MLQTNRHNIKQNPLHDIVTMSDNSTEGEQHKQVMEYLKKIVKDKLEKKNMERIKHLDLLYSKAVDDINVINTDKISDEDINRIKDEFNGSGKS